MLNLAVQVGERIRVAVFGGDKRVEDLKWPIHLDVRHFEYKHQSTVNSLVKSIKAGSIDYMILLTNLMGHSAYDTLRHQDVPIFHWRKSPGQLSREIASLIPPGSLIRHMTKKPKDSPMTGPVRPVVTPTPPPPQEKKIPVEAAQELKIHKAIEINIDPMETFGVALSNIIKREGITQSQFGKKVGHNQATISYWTRKGRPANPDKLLALYPELSRFFNKIEVVDAIQEKKEEIMNNVVSFTPTYSESLLRKWRKAREDLDKSKKVLEEIEMEMATFPGL